MRNKWSCRIGRSLLLGSAGRFVATDRARVASKLQMPSPRQKKSVAIARKRPKQSAVALPIRQGEFPRIDLPIKPPYPPMEARSVEEIPAKGDYLFEPKWDGFRCLVFRSGKKVLLQSKAGQPLALATLNAANPVVFRSGAPARRINRLVQQGLPGRCPLSRG